MSCAPHQPWSLRMKPVDGDVVQEAGEDRLLVVARVHGVLGGLQEVVVGPETVLEEVQQRRLRRHLLQARVVALEGVVLRVARRHHVRLVAGAAGVALAHDEQRRLRDAHVQLVKHALFKRIDLLGRAHAGGLAGHVRGSPLVAGILGSRYSSY